MMNQWIVPNLNQRQQRQEQVEGEEMNTSPPHHHLRTDQNLNYVVPMSNYEVAELTWENGQLGLHGFGTGNNFPCHQTKLPTWSREEEDTLESIVHQATFSNSNSNINISHSNGKLLTSSSGKWGEKSSSHSNLQGKQSVGTKLSPIGESLGGKWKENLGPEKNYGLRSSSMDESLGRKREENSGGLDLIKKRVRVMEEEKCGKKRIEVEESESATFFSRDFRDKSMRRCEESAAGSLRNTRNTDDNSAFSENQKEERVTTEERLTRPTRRRSHAAAVHNQSERRRRDRINEKMKALQKLVPNASKTDKASMLDEVIEHLKQLQAQIQMMSNARNMSQVVMPLGMQQQLQMSLLARMGMGMGMGITPAAPLCGATPPFVSSSYVTPSIIPPLPPLKANFDSSTINSSVSLSDAYNTFLAQQSMNMDFFNKMTSLYKQKANQSSKNLSQPNDGRGK